MKGGRHILNEHQRDFAKPATSALASGMKNSRYSCCADYIGLSPNYFSYHLTGSEGFRAP